jgi:hypothetical protein
MKIVIEVPDNWVTNCESTDAIMRQFVQALQNQNKPLYDYIFQLGVDQGWNESGDQHEHYHCPSCDEHRYDDDYY